MNQPSFIVASTQSWRPVQITRIRPDRVQIQFIADPRDVTSQPPATLPAWTPDANLAWLADVRYVGIVHRERPLADDDALNDDVVDGFVSIIRAFRNADHLALDFQTTRYRRVWIRRLLEAFERPIEILSLEQNIPHANDTIAVVLNASNVLKFKWNYNFVRHRGDDSFATVVDELESSVGRLDADDHNNRITEFAFEANDHDDYEIPDPDEISALETRMMTIITARMSRLRKVDVCAAWVRRGKAFPEMIDELPPRVRSLDWRWRNHQAVPLRSKRVLYDMESLVLDVSEFDEEGYLTMRELEALFGIVNHHDDWIDAEAYESEGSEDEGSEDEGSESEGEGSESEGEGEGSEGEEDATEPDGPQEMPFARLRSLTFLLDEPRDFDDNATTLRRILTLATLMPELRSLYVQIVIMESEPNSDDEIEDGNVGENAVARAHRETYRERRPVIYAELCTLIDQIPRLNDIRFHALDRQLNDALNAYAQRRVNIAKEMFLNNVLVRSTIAPGIVRYNEEIRNTILDFAVERFEEPEWGPVKRLTVDTYDIKFPNTTDFGWVSSFRIITPAAYQRVHIDE